MSECSFFSGIFYRVGGGIWWISRYGKDMKDTDPVPESSKTESFPCRESLLSINDDQSGRWIETSSNQDNTNIKLLETTDLPTIQWKNSYEWVSKHETRMESKHENFLSPLSLLPKKSAKQRFHILKIIVVWQGRVDWTGHDQGQPTKRNKSTLESSAQFSHARKASGFNVWRETLAI